MTYFLAFLEGVVTFVSPCLLPMLPIYLSYFAAGSADKKKTIANCLGFIVGFAIVFVALGAFASLLGGFFVRYSFWVNIIAGAIVVTFGLNYLGVIFIPFLLSSKKMQMNGENLTRLNFFSSVLFGAVFSIGWTPCVGVFLGSALMMAASSADKGAGVILLLSYSIGLGVPFLLAAILLDTLKSTFNFIKRHYSTINKISGGLLVVIGILIMTGVIGKLTTMLA